MTALDIHSASYATVFLARSGNKGNIHISQWPGVRFQTKKTGKNSKAKKTLWFNFHRTAKTSKDLKEHKKTNKQIHIHVEETNANSCANFRIPLAHIIHGDGVLIYIYSYMGVFLLIFLSKVPRMLSNKSLKYQECYPTNPTCKRVT